MAAQVPALFDVADVVRVAPANETRDPSLLVSHVRLVAPTPTKLDDDERRRLADLLTPAVRACLRGIAKRAARRSGEDPDDLEQRALEIACARIRTYAPHEETSARIFPRPYGSG